MLDVRVLIAECEGILNSPVSTTKQKLESINTIVQLKSNNDKALYYNELYRDVKLLIHCYLTTIDDRKYGYDVINVVYLEDNITMFDKKEKIALYDFLIRDLRKNGFETEITYFLKRKTSSEIQLIAEKLPKKWIDFTSKIITYNSATIILTVLLSYLIYSILLLPSKSSIVLYEVNYKQLSDNFLINHFCNSLLGIFGLHSDEFVVPTNVYGAFLSVLGKILFILIILNICINKFIDNFKSKF